MFGELVARHRRRLSLTQEELAASTGLSARTIRALESDKGQLPRPASVRLLADAFGLTGAEREAFVLATTGTRAPAQLPADVRGFVGRAGELAALDRLTAATSAVVISAVSGTAGVGKTALAIHWAHRAAGRFPDGQLYVDLRGYHPDRPMSPADALTRFLTALGVPGSEIPLDPDDRAARFRTQTAGRRLLIVLDNAATVDQVRPLLPGTATCSVLVTSRDSLAGLVALLGAHRVDLDLLPADEAAALLRRLIGARAEADPVAVATLAGQCARLPLALRVAAELAVARPGVPLARLVAELADQQGRLDLLDAGGDPHAAVTAVFSWSLRHLPDGAARMFRLLGVHPGADFDAYAAGALAGLGVDRARRLLDTLSRAHLVHRVGPDRFGMHDLLRTYAAQLASIDDPRAALTRLFDHHLAASAAAMAVLHPGDARPEPPALTWPEASLPPLADADAARTWLDAERAGLVVSAAASPQHAVRLSVTLFRYLGGSHLADALAVHESARQAAEAAGDRHGTAHALLGLGIAHRDLGHLEAAAEQLDGALTRFREAGDPAGQALALNGLGGNHAHAGRYAEGLACVEQALSLFRAAGDRVGQARALSSPGGLERRLGNLPAAAGYQREALELAREMGNHDSAALALSMLGLVRHQLGEDEPAAGHLREAVELYRTIGDHYGEACARDNLGMVLTGLGRPAEAVENFERAVAVFRESDDVEGESWSLNGLGEAAWAAGRPGDARSHHEAALAMAIKAGAVDQQIRAHTGLADACGELGDPVRADEHRARVRELSG